MLLSKYRLVIKPNLDIFKCLTNKSEKIIGVASKDKGNPVKKVITLVGSFWITL